MNGVGAMRAAGPLAEIDAASGRPAHPKGRWPGAAPPDPYDSATPFPA
jgi:hypothetical protein